jgi:hypothetical protein
MPLSSGYSAPLDNSGVISLQMHDRERIVRVDVKYDVLLGPHLTDSEEAIIAFKLNQDIIERLASAKYDSDDCAEYANGSVVSILAEELGPVKSGAARLREISDHAEAPGSDQKSEGATLLKPYRSTIQSNYFDAHGRATLR